MPEEKRQIFREQSLEKLSSPDRLDEMLRIVNPPAWILMGTVGVGFALLLVWSVFGSIPASVNGTAILVHPKKVVAFQSRATGSIEEILVEVGQEVEKGDVLARVRLPQIEKLLKQEEDKRDHFLERSGRMTKLEQYLEKREKDFLNEQRKLLLGRAADIKKRASDARASDEDYISNQRSNIESSRTLLAKLLERLEKQNEGFARLEKEGVLRVAEAIEAQRQLIDIELRLAALEARESELALRDTISMERLNSQLDLANDLGVQTGALNLRELEIHRRMEADVIVNETEIEDIKARIAQLELQRNEGCMKADDAGRVIELTVVRGQHVSIGQRLGNLKIEDESSLQALAYFPIKAGKKLRLDMPIRISPTTVERERFGAIRGQVQFISSYPITTEAAGNQIGNVDVARRLLGGESRIEVIADLDEALTPTKFAWTSGDGPPDTVAITPGTTASVRVTIEELRPIDLLLPFLRSLGGS